MSFADCFRTLCNDRWFSHSGHHLVHDSCSMASKCTALHNCYAVCACLVMMCLINLWLSFYIPSEFWIVFTCTFLLCIVTAFVCSPCEFWSHGHVSQVKKCAFHRTWDVFSKPRSGHFLSSKCDRITSIKWFFINFIL